MAAPGFRVITTTYKYFLSREEAKAEALKGRGEGKKTEIITEDEYQRDPGRHIPMQDLSKF